MATFENSFFREATLRICGSLELRAAMRRFLDFLRNFMPADGMFLNQFEPSLSVMRILAHVSYDNEIRMDEVLPMNEDAVEEYKLRERETVLRPEKRTPISVKISEVLEMPEISLLVLHMNIDGERIGSLAIYKSGYEQYTKEHARLLSILHDPVAIAVSNALRYHQAMEVKNILAEANRLERQQLYQDSSDIVIGQNLGLKGVMEKVRQVAPLNNPVLILGETGVGKEVIANAIHALSPRMDAPFIKVNCGAIPEHLVDSELFGHEKGSFTGAISRKLGKFELANKGSLLLDEIGELKPSIQVKFLRVLQHKQIERIGGTESIPIDVRFMAATHKDLDELVSSNLFREDLWFRLNVFPIDVPPLRERKEDIPLLVHHILKRKSKELNLYDFPKLAPGAIEQLKSYGWPGNVRELENILERELIRMRGEKDDSPLRFESLIYPGYKRDDMIASNGGAPPPKLEKAVARCIIDALKIAKGKIQGVGGAAEMLGINPNTLRSKMKKLGIPSQYTH
ncbi:sigma 54-interacting transcriptional regulator [Thermodesulfobacteriota bacterium]